MAILVSLSLGLLGAVCSAAAVSPYIANVVAYGADPSGASTSTQAIAAAVQAISSNGGGTLYFPPGIFLTSPFNITSNLQLYLDNATLSASPNFSDWTIIEPLPSYGRGRDFPGPRYCAFIGCYNCSNVTISGTPGAANVIDGNGADWWQAIVNGSLLITPGHLVELAYGSSYEISWVTLTNSPFWHLHIYSSQGAWVHDMAVVAPEQSTNTDGVDPDSSRDVLIERVNINNGDDCIAVKSGWNQAGVAYGHPTVNITIRDMVCSTRSACLAIGSEMSGSIYNVHASGITCMRAGQLLNVKSCLGRGGVVSNITLADSVIVGAVGTGIAVVDNYKDQYPPGPIDPTLIPQLGGVHVRNVTAVPGSSVATAGDFGGIGATPATGSINGVYLQDVDLSAGNKGVPWKCVNVTGTVSGSVLPPVSQGCPQLA